MWGTAPVPPMMVADTVGDADLRPLRGEYI